MTSPAIVKINLTATTINHQPLPPPSTTTKKSNAIKVQEKSHCHHCPQPPTPSTTTVHYLYHHYHHHRPQLSTPSIARKNNQQHNQNWFVDSRLDSALLARNWGGGPRPWVASSAPNIMVEGSEFAVAKNSASSRCDAASASPPYTGASTDDLPSYSASPFVVGVILRSRRPR
ncbi:Hypothetical predicted protein [Olea europaea subsp. europaea]|uniref:Uncharacterized protein n=1 Tax=Olea europaea subsp. europaea TaxID=158383 RepID=A0A8S0S5E3_OLEEU|nr:Hypothetical predicted protein [Olea europaea subsp. europaea]